jgi:glutamate racemase
LDKRPIGVFDSGVGGLTVVSKLWRVLPDEEIVYFGDTQHLPYGNKSPEAVTGYSRRIAKFLISQDVKLVVVACNTASAVALNALKREFKIPVIGVIKPGVHAAIAATKNGRIGIIGTRSTIASGAYESALKSEARRAGKKISYFARSCPLFVPLVEENWWRKPAALDIANDYLSSFKNKNIDTLILGCTHYPIMKSVVRKVIGSKITLVESGFSVAAQIKSLLTDADALRHRSGKQCHKFFVSDGPEHFRTLSRVFLGRSIPFVKEVTL